MSGEARLNGKIYKYKKIGEKLKLNQGYLGLKKFLPALRAPLFWQTLCSTDKVNSIIK